MKIVEDDNAVAEEIRIRGFTFDKIETETM